MVGLVSGHRQSTCCSLICQCRPVSSSSHLQSLGIKHLCLDLLQSRFFDCQDQRHTHTIGLQTYIQHNSLEALVTALNASCVRGQSDRHCHVHTSTHLHSVPKPRHLRHAELVRPDDRTSGGASTPPTNSPLQLTQQSFLVRGHEGQGGSVFVASSRPGFWDEHTYVRDTMQG